MSTSEERKKGKLPIFQKRFNELRGEMSQDEFAKFIGVSRATVGFYENGERVPDAITLIKIADVCDIDVEYLLGRSDVRRGSADDRVLQKRFGFDDKAIKVFDQLASGKSQSEIDLLKLNTQPDELKRFKLPEAQDYIGFINLLFHNKFDEVIRELYDVYKNYVNDKKEEAEYYEGKSEYEIKVRREMQMTQLSTLEKLGDFERGICEGYNFYDEDTNNKFDFDDEDSFLNDGVIQPMRIAYFDAEGSLEFMLNMIKKNIERMIRTMEKEDRKNE